LERRVVTGEWSDLDSMIAGDWRCDVTFRYIANLHGAPAVASITFQQLYSYVYMSGEIRSNQAAYSFHADIYGDGGYGEMLDQYRGERFQIQIQNLTTVGFTLTSNPFLSPTSYYFAYMPDS
jgi:hypothetical protein